VGIVLDLSDSTQKSWADARGPLIRFLAEVMRPKDELLVLAFNSRIEIERTIADPAQLETALQPPASGGLTALYDAIYHTCGHAIFVGDREPHRSALILFSDGEDDLSLHGRTRRSRRRNSTGFRSTPFQPTTRKLRTRGDSVLHDIAESTRA
jgi:Mg-chelatase subunit ChlD